MSALDVKYKCVVLYTSLCFKIIWKLWNWLWRYSNYFNPTHPRL